MAFSPQAETPTLAAQLSHLVLTTAGLTAALGLATLFLGQRFLLLYLLNFTAVPILGKFTPILALDPSILGWLDPGLAVSPWEIGVIVGLGDACAGFLFTQNLALAFRLPRVGPVLAEIERRSARLLELQPWMRRLTFLGMAAFVVFPLSGTGALGGSVFSRLLGLSPWRATLAIACGGFAGALLFTALIVVFGAAVRGAVGPTEATVGGIALILLLVWILNRRYRRALEAPPAEAEARAEVER